MNLKVATQSAVGGSHQQEGSPPDDPQAFRRTLAPRAKRLSNPPAGELDPPPAGDLPRALESLLFVASEPVDLPVLARALRVRVADIERAADELAEQLRSRGLRLQRAEGRLQMVTSPEWSHYIERFLGVAAEQPLSTAALETLAIIAYRQPQTRAGIEAIRGVNSERALATLRTRGLVDEVGRAEGVGRPVLYGTTMQFLQLFGLESLAELPALPAEEEI